MTPRPYQTDCIEQTEAAFVEVDRVLDVLPTGSGKTIIFSWLAARRWQEGERTLIIAHRDELITQARDKLQVATGIGAEIKKAEQYASFDAPVVIASIQTLQKRFNRWPSDHFGLIICDEAHHSVSEQWRVPLRHFEGQVLGVTATCRRTDDPESGMRLSELYQRVGYEISILELIRQGYLSRIVWKAFPLQIDLAGVESKYDPEVAGQDFSKNQMARIIEPYLDQIAVEIGNQAGFRRMLGFTPLIDTARKAAEACQKAGLRSEFIYGEDPDRGDKLKRFRNWEFDSLWNSGLLAEGFDDPGIDCIFPLRATRSQSLYWQWIGRGTRIFDGKENLLILDPLWLHKTHRIMGPACLVAKDDFEEDQMKAAVHGGLPAELADQLPMEIESLKCDAQAQREEALRKRLEANKGKKSEILSADDFALVHHSLDVAEYAPTMAWESQPLRDYELKNLKRAKIDPASVRGRGHAKKLLELYWTSRKLQAASPAQKRLMSRMHYPNAEQATAQDARDFFARLNKRKKERELV